MPAFRKAGAICLTLHVEIDVLPVGPPSNDRDSGSTTVVGALADHWATLLPEEQASFSGVSAHRRLELSTTRFLARRAMAARGLPPAPVLRAADRSPQWPAGVRGSLTHSRELVAASVSTGLLGLGIDLEHLGRLSEGGTARILTSTEAAWLAALPTADRHTRATLVFSAKEAVYKAIYPTAGVYVGYREVEVVVDPTCWSFTARFVGDNSLNRPIGRGRGVWWHLGDAILTRFEIEGES